ncbi:hypothetical protein V3W47_07770 [Deinococcus sp. YIM 134068]|uniref:hypothetical protein n=1 Tax=Deinococcus lichenicola TaxID=3118910 RepID=UPI002F95FD4D
MESVVALFREPQQAQGALAALQARGFDRDRLGFALIDAVAEDTIAQATGISPEAGAPGGSASVIRGTLLGALVSLVLTLPIWGLLALIPETRVYAEGGLLVVIYGLIGGAGLGGIFGALTGSDHGDYVKLLRRMGVPAPQAERFYNGLKSGHILVIARDPDGVKTNEALNVMRRHGAVRLEDVEGGGRLQSEREGQDGH